MKYHIKMKITPAEITNKLHGIIQKGRHQVKYRTKLRFNKKKNRKTNDQLRRNHMTESKIFDKLHAKPDLESHVMVRRLGLLHNIPLTVASSGLENR